MFLFRRRVAAPAPVVPPFIYDEYEERFESLTKRSAISTAGFFSCQLFLLFILKFLKKPDVENFVLQPMDQYHRFMFIIMLLFFLVFLYHMVFISYDRAESIFIMANPLFVSIFFR